MPAVSAAVVNWNGVAYLADCLTALLAQEPAPAEVLLIDNHSDDGSRELVAGRFPSVRIVDTGRNGGPGLARNVALAQARHELLLLVDNDVVLEPGALAALLRSRDAGGARTAIVQARSVLAERPDVVHYDAADVHFLGLLVLRNFFRPRVEATAPAGPVGGAVSLCMLVDRGACLAAGGFFEELFFFFEDTEFALGLRLRGHEIRLAADAIVRHRGGTQGLSMRGEGAAFPARRAYYHSRNRMLVLLTTARWRTLLVTLPSHALYELVHFLFALAHGHALPWIRGKLSRLTLLRAALRRRRARQHARVVADRELFVAAPLTTNPGLAERGLAAGVRRVLDRCFRWNWQLARWARG